jgi:hypothetical protein
MVLLSACFVRGEGVPRDIIVGYAWSIVSTIWGKDNKRAIKLRDDLEKTIENIQKDAGQELAKRINRAIEDNKFNKKGLSSENLPREAVRLFQD